jgi:hypothetical protein
MANHAHVYTKKHMDASKVRILLDRLNRDVFLDSLEINQEDWDGQPAWYLHVKDEPEGHETRVCWLNSKRDFEIRHGGGSDFLWWIDFRVQDEISKVFDGSIVDDGDDTRITSYDMPDSYSEYVRKSLQYYTQNLHERKSLSLEEIGLYLFSRIRFKLWGYPKCYSKAYHAKRRLEKASKK